jgi:hypothetical protein
MHLGLELRRKEGEGAMNTTVVGLLTGLALGFAGYFGGFGAFIVVAVVGLVGMIVGHLARGDVHIADYIHTRDNDEHRETFERPRSHDRHRETFERPPSTPARAPRTDHRTRVR